MRKMIVLRAAAAVITVGLNSWVAASESEPGANEPTTNVTMSFVYQNERLEAPIMRFIPRWQYDEDDVGRIDIEGTEDYWGLELCLWSDNVTAEKNGTLFMQNARSVQRPVIATWERGGDVKIGNSSTTAACDGVHGRGAIVLHTPIATSVPGEYTATIHGRYKVP